MPFIGASFAVTKAGENANRTRESGPELFGLGLVSLFYPGRSTKDRVLVFELEKRPTVQRGYRLGWELRRVEGTVAHNRNHGRAKKREKPTFAERSTTLIRRPTILQASKRNQVICFDVSLPLPIGTITPAVERTRELLAIRFIMI